jgi:plasmid stabilization system protein ParE
VEAITAFIAKDSVNYAKRFGQRLREAPKPLKLFPRLGAVVPEFDRETLRELLVGSYRVIYEVREPDCYIIAVVHGSRDLGRAMPPPSDANES